MTQKEYTGPEFEIEFARAWYEYVKGGKVGVDPRTLIEQRPNAGWGWVECDLDSLMRGISGQYRWKPAPKRMVTIGYSVDGMPTKSKTLVAPEVEAPAMGTVYYCQTTDLHPRCVWDGAEYDTIRLDKGLVFLTREDAQAMSDWLATCRKGRQS